MYEIISYKRAKYEKRTRYFTGKPCKQGHICERYVSNSGCVQCVNKYATDVHPMSSQLVPLKPHLWVVKGFPDNYHEALRDYLQKCVNSFCELNATNNLELANDLGKLGGFRP